MESSEREQREAVVRVARSLLPTPVGSGPVPWRHMGRTAAGLDCGGAPIFVFKTVALLEAGFETEFYPPDFMMHRDEERFLDMIERFCKRVSGPHIPAFPDKSVCRYGHAVDDGECLAAPRREPRDGDIPMFRVGRLIAHCAIVDRWPRVIHAVRAGGQVRYDDCDKGELASRSVGIWTLKEWT